MSTIIEKDRHMKIKKPFFEAQKAYNEWFLKQEFNNIQNTFISLGDLFDKSIPTPDEVYEMLSFFDRCRFKDIYLLAGNHDYSNVEKSYSFAPLKNNPRIHLITNKCRIKIEDKYFLFLPFMQTNLQTRQAYEKIEELDNDYICYHFEDESIQYGKKKTGISSLTEVKGERIGGHIHTSQKNYELGMPVLSRYDERYEKNNLLVISDKKTFIEVPKFISYEEVIYPNELPESKDSFTLWDILDAPSSKIARTFYREKYPDIHIREVHVKSKKEDAIQNSLIEDGFSIKKAFDNYIMERSDLSENSIQRLRGIINKE